MIIGNQTKILATLVAAAFAFTANAQTIVYQDNYDGDGIEVNAGIGGGAISQNTSPASIEWAEGWWTDDGNLTMGALGGWGGMSGGSYSINGFTMPDGFKLEVTYNALSASDRFTMGLMETAGTEQRAATGTESWEIGYLATSGSSLFEGIYFNAFAYDSKDRYPDAPGLQLADGTGMVQLSDEQTRATGEHTLVLEMDAESNWSYSVDGAEPTTGTIAGDGFDLTKSYHFITRNQPRRASQIIDVTLTSLATPVLEGDFNRDDQVDQGDLSLLLVNWGLNTGEPPEGWSPEAWDPAVDQEELSALLANWGAGTGAAAAVPEPSTFALAGLALLGLVGFARRKR